VATGKSRPRCTPDRSGDSRIRSDLYVRRRTAPRSCCHWCGL